MEEVNRSYARMVDLLKTTGRHLAELVGAESARVTPSDSSAIALGTAACMTGMDGAAWERLPDTTGLTKAEVVDKNGTNAALVHNSDKGRELAWPRLPSSDHLAIRHPERRHGVENLAPDPCLNSLCRQPSRSHR